MEHDDFIVLPGDCFRCEDTTEGIRVAQVIRPLNDDTLAVFFWTQDPEQCYYLPTVLRRSSEQGVIDKPRTLSSLVFVHHANDVLSYSKVPSRQSISCLASEGIERLAMELHKIL